MVKALPCLLHAFRGWLSPTVLIRACFRVDKTNERALGL